MTTTTPIYNPTDILSRSTFPQPFSTASYSWLPSTMNGVYELCETVYRTNGIFRAGLDRIARLFMTDYIFKNGEETESKKIIRKLLDDHKEQFISIVIDYLLYGNSYNSIYLPFKRLVSCTQCSTSAENEQSFTGRFAIEKIKNLTFTGSSFKGTCPICNNTVVLDHQDIVSKNYNDINIVRHSPKQIDIMYEKWSNKSQIAFTQDSDEISDIKNSNTNIILYNTPLIALQAAYENKQILFNPDQILHLAQPNIAGKNIKWGMPFVISCFPLVFYISILRKANEAISADYIIPMRILFPQNGASGQEGTFANNHTVINKIKEIIDTHRIDPNGYYTTPAPIGYQVIGGEKKSLMISEDLKLSSDELLNSMGFPVELFYGSISYQAAPMSLRMLDNTFGLTLVYNKLIKWFVDSVCSYYSLPKIEVTIQPLRFVDDGEKRQFMLQAASADKVSEISLFEMYNLNWEDENRKKIQQTQILRRLQQEEAEKVQIQQQQQDSMSTDGLNPMQIIEKAQSMAQQLLTMDEGTRRSELDNLGKVQPLLHHAVIGEMEKMTNKMKTQGKNQILQQMQGQ